MHRGKMVWLVYYKCGCCGAFRGLGKLEFQNFDLKVAHRVDNAVMAAEFADDFAGGDVPQEDLTVAAAGSQPEGGSSLLSALERKRMDFGASRHFDALSCLRKVENVPVVVG